LFLASNLYRRRTGGDLQFDGVRPAEGWHGHGYFPRWLWVLARGRLQRMRIWKHRWRPRRGGPTCHSRPPDELAGLGFCSLVVVLKLWSWLDGGRGVHQSQQVLGDLEMRGDPRTVQRWLRQLLPDAMVIQQAVRLAVIERCEPRPLEQLFPTGLSPPSRLVRRPWRDPSGIDKLWRALALLLGGAIRLDVQVALLLAEARRRCDTAPENSI
jgi:hypothetical protein